MLRRALFSFTLLFAVTPLMAAMEGMTVLPSQHSVEQTTERLLTELEAKGMNVFDQVDHAAGARKADMQLEPTTVVLFGNPEIGTQLMHCSRSVAIDLPMKALIWEDDDGVWFAYNDAEYLNERHDLGECTDVLAKVERALEGFAKAATEG
jgi:uncharacterized protein (DUF302 family)